MKRITAMGSSKGLPDRIRVELAADDVVVFDPDRGVAHRIAQLEARMLADGQADPFLATLGPEVAEAVTAALSVQRWDRRTLLGSGSALAAAGVATLLLPSAVAAASPFDQNIGSLGGFDEGEIVFTAVDGGTLTTSTDPFFVSTGSTVNFRAHGRWTIPSGVERVQIVAYSTSGTTAFALNSSTEPSPYTGQPGRGVQAVGTFELPSGANRYLGIFFSGATQWAGSETPSGGAGGSGVGAAFIDAGTSTVAWLLVAGGGGGAGDARTWRNDPARYLDAGAGGSAVHVGGDGGDAGTGGAAQAGGPGTVDGVADGRGGGGATLSAFGAKGSGGAGIDGFAGTAFAGPTTTMSNSSQFANSLGFGGGQANTLSLPGGNGGGGLYGGGGGEAGSSGYAGGGGGGGSSLLNATYLDGLVPSRILRTNRAHALGPTIAVYW